MKRSLLLMFLALVVIAGVLISGCGGATTTSSTTTTTTTSKPATSTTAQLTTSAAAPPATTMTATTKATTKVVPTGTLRVAEQTFSYESFDQNFYTSMWGWAIYDPLITVDKNANFIPSVADSYSLSADGLTWTFKIHKGITFSNGDPLTAADVKFSVDRFSSNTSSNPWSSYLRLNYKSDAVVDDYTYTYTCTKTEPPLAIPFSNVLIIPKSYFEKNGQDYFRANPVGSGPYKLTKLVSSTSMTLEARPDYWGQVASWKTVIDYLVPEESTRIAMLKSGDVDIAFGITADREIAMKALGYQLKESALATLGNISFQQTWQTDGPTKDIRVRQAMSYSVNRQEMCDTFYKGLAAPGGRWQMQTGVYGWDSTWQPDAYDVAKATQLLKDAGYPNNFKDPVIKIYAQGYQMDMINMLVGYWNKVGIQTKVTTVDSLGFSKLFFAYNRDSKSDANGAVIPWYYSGTYNSLYHSANMYCSYGQHGTGGPNEAKAGGADELYAKAASDLDPAQAMKDYTAFIQYGYNMWVNVGMVQVKSYAVCAPTVGDFQGPLYMGFWYYLNTIQHK
jgi:peptide/nickel transport system substrate-binding protein